MKSRRTENGKASCTNRNPKKWDEKRSRKEKTHKKKSRRSDSTAREKKGQVTLGAKVSNKKKQNTGTYLRGIRKKKKKKPGKGPAPVVMTAKGPEKERGEFRGGVKHSNI